MSVFVCLSDKFKEVRHYVKNGLPEDHFSLDFASEPPEGDGDKRWMDDADYSLFPPEILAAARFRDGLVLDDEVYSEFRTDFGYSYWSDEYKKHSEIVFRHLRAQYLLEEQEPTTVLCGLEGHEVDDGDVFCHTSEFEICLMRYHVSHVEGFQSQSYMRDKVLCLLHADIEKLPKSSQTKEPSAKTKTRWVHALTVVVSSLSYHQDWLMWKIYSMDDFTRVGEAAARVHNVLMNLIKFKYFDSSQRLARLFAMLCKCIKGIDEMNDELTSIDLGDDETKGGTRFFSAKWLKKYDEHLTALRAAHGDIDVKDEEDEEEEEEKDEKEEGVGTK